MPCKRTKQNTDWKKGPSNNTPYARIKYMNTCIKAITESLPQQTYTNLCPMYYESCCEKDYPKTFSKKSNILLKGHYFESFPLHPRFGVCCSFCDTPIPPLSEVPGVFEHPHSRRRYTPMCSECTLANERTEQIKKGFV